MKNAGLFLIGGIVGVVVLMLCICGSLFTLGMILDAPAPTPIIIRATAVPQTHELTVYNLTDRSICFLYLSRSSSDVWGPDQLRTDVILSGYRFTLYGIEPGSYDLKAETCGGSEALGFNFSIYSDVTWTVYE